MNAGRDRAVYRCAAYPLPEGYAKRAAGPDLCCNIFLDITNRHKKENPNRRWTYTEVQNWCKGKKQVIPGEGVGMAAEKAIPTYTFLGQGYKDIPSLITALASN